MTDSLRITGSQVFEQEQELEAPEEMLERMNFKFSKEYFVTEKGEIVKIAGIVTQDTKILAALQK